jgi:uncharacterized protein (TIGR02328 family)
MRIWHESLIPKLCRQHLLAMWRESLGCYKIVTNEVDGGTYRKHPATKEFLDHPQTLWRRLYAIKQEMKKRGYHPKELPKVHFNFSFNNKLVEWQSLDEQISILKAKGCNCQV